MHSLKELENKKIIKLKNFKSLYFNHYYFLNKSVRGRDKCDWIDDSLVKYYDILNNLKI